MSSFTIKDAKGGSRAGVTPSGRVLTSGANTNFLAQCSLDNEEAYILHGVYTLPAHVDTAPQNAGTLGEGYPVHWFRNDHPDKMLVMQQVQWGSNGGGPSLNADVTWDCKFFFADQGLPPDAAGAGADNVAVGVPAYQYAPKRMNIKNGTPPQILVKAWDGVGNGIQMPAGSWNPARRVFNGIVGKGQSSFDIACSIIIPPGGPSVLHVFDAPDLAIGETLKLGVTWFCCHVDADEYTKSL